MADDQTPDVVAAIEDVREEVETRREREKERHQQKLADINEFEAERMDELAQRAGLDELTLVHEEITNLRDEILGQRREIKRYVGQAVNTLLPQGGYEKTITLKDGWVYRYGKKRNPSLPFTQVVEFKRRYGRALEALVEGALSDVEANAVKLAFSRLAEDNPYDTETWSRTVEVDHSKWNEIKLRYKKAEYDRNRTEYVKFNTGSTYSSESMAPDTRDPEDLAVLAAYSDEVLAMAEDIRAQLAAEKNRNTDTFEQLKQDLPVDPEEIE